MSWRLLLFGAAVIVLLYGAADVVFSSGSPHREPGVSHSRPADQEPIDPTIGAGSSAHLEGCPVPTDLPEGATSYSCLTMETNGPAINP